MAILGANRVDIEKHPSSASLFQLPFTLEEHADALEVRIWADEAATLGIAGYSIERIEPIREEMNP